jgi:nitrate reductase beta subunit
MLQLVEVEEEKGVNKVVLEIQEEILLEMEAVQAEAVLFHLAAAVLEAAAVLVVTQAMVVMVRIMQVMEVVQALAEEAAVAVGLLQTQIMELVAAVALVFMEKVQVVPEVHQAPMLVQVVEEVLVEQQVLQGNQIPLMELTKAVKVDYLAAAVAAQIHQEMAAVEQCVLFGQVMLENFLQPELLMSRALTAAKINILSSTRD